MVLSNKVSGNFDVFIRYDDEKKYRPFAEGCDLCRLSLMCGMASRLSQVKYIRIDKSDKIKPFKRFTL